MWRHRDLDALLGLPASRSQTTHQLKPGWATRLETPSSWRGYAVGRWWEVGRERRRWSQPQGTRAGTGAYEREMTAARQRHTSGGSGPIRRRAVTRRVQPGKQDQGEFEASSFVARSQAFRTSLEQVPSART